MPAINGNTVKRELADKRIKKVERRALLSGLVRSCLSLIKRKGGGGFLLSFDCQTDFVRELASSLMLEEFKVTPSGDGSSLVFADCDKLLRGLGILDGEGSFVSGIPDKYAHSALYARGVFLGAGSVSIPPADSEDKKSSGYHLEFALNSDEFASEFKALLNGYGIHAHTTERGEKTVVYIKSSEGVSDCLALIGAEKTVLRLNETVATNAFRRDMVMLNNCEIANFEKTIKASVDIIGAIERISAASGLDSLDDKLREAAEIRVAHPQARLADLAKLLGISKSGLKHRFDKIIELAPRE